MKLERFKENSSRRKLLITFAITSILLLAGVLFYTSFAIYEDIKTFNIITGTIPDIGEALYVYHLPDGTVTTLSSRVDSSLVLDETNSTCNYGVVPKWVNGAISLDKTNATNTSSQKIRCEAYMVEYQFDAVETLMTLASNTNPESTGVIDYGEVKDENGEALCTNTLAYDDFGNLRYVGANPCNYVTFNEEEPMISDAWQLYANQVYNNFETKNECEEQLGISKIRFGNKVSMACTLNSENKYDLSINGFIDLYGKYSSFEECEESLEDRVTLNASCELNGIMVVGGWRIIGVFDGQLKLIRNESIGNYSWDSSASSINNGLGVNQWGESTGGIGRFGIYEGADLMRLLNNLYWNREGGQCYLGWNDDRTTCDFSTTGLTGEAQEMISFHTWYTGTSGEIDTYTSNNGLGTSKKYYEYERSENTGKLCTSGTWCNDTVTRTTTWDGYVGLMYPSDYGYAVGGEARIGCISNTNLDSYGDASCYMDNWLFNGKEQYTIMPTYYTFESREYANYVMIISNYGGVTGGSACGDNSISIDIRPSLYLVPEASISGDGTPTNPFEVIVD